MQQRSPKKSSRRGAALVLTLILGIGLLAVVSVLTSLGQEMARSEGRRRELKVVQEAVNAGISMAMNEINRRRLGGNAYPDPTGHGFGAMLFQLGPATQSWDTMGMPLVDAQGRIIGRIRADVRAGASPGRSVLTVVAAWPSFNTPPERRVLAAAEVEITRGRPPFDRNALSIRGDADVGGTPGVHGGSNQMDISGIDPTYPVPAVNVSDTSSYQDFVSNLNRFGTIDGAYADGSGQIEDGSTPINTIDNTQSGVLNENTVNLIAAGIDARVASALSTGTQITAAQALSGGTLANGTYYINQDVEVGGSASIVGRGTLVITKKVRVKGTIDWDGDVILANENGAIMEIIAGGEVKVADKTPGSSDGSGILGVQASGDATNLGLSIKGKLTVGALDGAGNVIYPGGLTVLGNENTPKTVVSVLSGGRLDVHGIFTIMGNNLDIEFRPGGEIAVDGSMALVTPAGSTTGVDINFKNGMHMDLKFRARSFDTSLEALGTFFDPNGTLLPVSSSAYWEAGAVRAYQAQNARLGLVDRQPFSPINATTFGF